MVFSGYVHDVWAGRVLVAPLATDRGNVRQADDQNQDRQCRLQIVRRGIWHVVAVLVEEIGNEEIHIGGRRGQ